jgi:hypothetical protein
LKRRPLAGQVRIQQRPAAPTRTASLEIDRHQSQPLGNTETQFVQTSALPGLGPGLVDLEHSESGGDLRPALSESVQTGAQNDVLGHPPIGLLGDQVLDEASTRHNPGPEPLGALWVHIGATAPIVVRSREPEADLVFETWGGGSTWTCMARHRATRRAVPSTASVCSSAMRVPPARLVSTGAGGSRKIQQCCIVGQTELTHQRGPQPPPCMSALIGTGAPLPCRNLDGLRSRACALASVSPRFTSADP